MSDKYVYSFGGGKADGTGTMKDILGGKGAGLAEMTNAGLPVPPGFTISTQACRDYFANGDKPLLVSVRSGAKFSMPGMMDTILNLGMNDESVEAVARNSGNERLACDSYRRFIQMFGAVVLEIPKHDFDHVFDSAKKKAKAKLDTDLNAGHLRGVIVEYKKLVQKKTGKPFPQDPREQLALARDAVFHS